MAKFTKIEEFLKDSLELTKDAFKKVKKATNIGTKKVSIYMLRNKVKEKLAELGSVTFRLLYEDKKSSITIKNDEIAAIMKEIEDLKTQMEDIEEEIEDLSEDESE